MLGNARQAVESVVIEEISQSAFSAAAGRWNASSAVPAQCDEDVLTRCPIRSTGALV